MDVKLYVIPGSHPAMTIRRMLELKGVDYKRVDLMPVVSKGALRAMRFPDNTVPAAKINGRRVQGSREIAHELDLLAPDPPIYPPEGPEREAVESAERWGDEALQAPIRRMLWNAFRRDRAPMESFSKGARLGVPISFAVKTGGPLVAAAAKLNKATDENVRADIAAMPGVVQRVDDWIADGVMGGEQLNAADLQIGASLRLAMTMDDIRPALEGHPAGELAMRAFPDYPGEVPPIFPAAWLEPLRRPATA
jgi:glutathione S-transferase